jgi:hypothetical protein
VVQPIACSGLRCVISADYEFHPPAVNLADNALAGTREIHVSSTSEFLARDEVLIYDAQGSNAGKYEFAHVAVLAANGVLTLAAPLTTAFDRTDQVEVVRVLHFVSLEVHAGATVTGVLWNGHVGGVLAIRVDETARIAGTLSVVGQGFRGGAGDAGLRASVQRLALQRRA